MSLRRALFLLSWIVLTAIACHVPRDEPVEQTGEAATAWAEKSLAAVTQLPIRCDYTTVNKFRRGDVPTVIELEGGGTFAEGPRSRTELLGESYPAADAELKIGIKIISVTDGSHNWWETTSPLDQPAVVIKSVATPEDGYPGVLGLVAGLVRDYEFTINSESEERVELKGVSKVPPYLAIVTLDTATGYPIEIRLGVDPESVHMQFESWERPVTVDEALFFYEIPEGATVQEVAAPVEPAAEEEDPTDNQPQEND